MKTIEERAEEYARNKFRDVLLISERDYLELVRDFSADYAKMATEQKAIDIERGKVFIKDLLLSIIGCEPKEGWIENILNEYEKTL